ncbi:MAG: hypothetical protein KH366_08725 [Clostridiaceae bacterium]|nr:hypothetical protein [Clostridiaceae bacterium]
MDSALKDIGAYKNRIISLLTGSQDIVSLLLNDTITDDNVENLVYSQIFPYLYVNDTQTEELSYLCIEVEVPRIPTKMIKDMKIIVWAYCHKGIMKYSRKDFLGTRADILSDMVDRCLMGSDNFGIGRPTLESDTHFFPNDKYYGRQLIYTMPEFKVKSR